MFSWVRRQLSPATVMAFVALVFAMTGGAYAVTGHGGSGPAASAGSASAVATAAKSKAKPKVKVGPRGPAGPAGAQGPAGPAGGTGPQGSAGATGAAGAKGENGAAGTNGTNGTNGGSVTSVESKSKIGPCEKGGSEFTSASGKTYACTGETGAPWPAGGTLPKGATETGVWSTGDFYDGETSGSKIYDLPVASFSIPLAAPLAYHSKAEEEGGAGANQVHFINGGDKEVREEETTPAPAACPGSIEKPEAESGNLCIYGTANAGVENLQSGVCLRARCGGGNHADIVFERTQLRGGVRRMGGDRIAQTGRPAAPRGPSKIPGVSRQDEPTVSCAYTSRHQAHHTSESHVSH